MIPSRIPLVNRLLEQSYEFQFFQAVRLLGLIGNDRPGLGAAVHPSEEIVRFEVRQSLEFPPSSISWIDTEPDPPRMAVTFFGLTGIQGVLPLHYTEHLLARAVAKDFAMARFFDIFNHRLISLFYRAWEKYNFPARYQLAEVRQQPCEITGYLLDLIGLGTERLKNRHGGISDHGLLRYAGLLAQEPHSATALERTLIDFFNQPIEVDQFVGGWHSINPDDQCTLEGEGLRNQLGEGALAGDAVWDPQAGISIRIGPLSLLHFLSFLPDGDAVEPLRDIARLYAGPAARIDWNPVLKNDEVQWCRLGDNTPLGPRLGWNAWLRVGEFPADAMEATFRMAE